MGRIKTTLIKRKTKEILATYSNQFKEDFEENKRLVAQFANIPSKKIRNALAGYITRIKKKAEV